ncbi:MAG: class I tRNA ligase family protein [Nanoarchaeota archaeon]
MNMENFGGKKPKKLEEIDRAFLERLQMLINSSTAHFDRYEYSKVKSEAEQFFWNHFCDNYLEIVKKRVYQGEGNKKASAQYTLYKSLLTILKIFAPIMPFITEEIYQKYFKKIEKDKSIHISKWPKVIPINPRNNIFTKFSLFEAILSIIRKEKSKAQKSMNAECIITLRKEDFSKLKNSLKDLQNVTTAKEIKQKDFKIGNLKVEFIN